MAKPDIKASEPYRIVRARGELYADLKKANLYYLLNRLTDEGDLTVQAEPGTRGRRGERLIYALTEQGRTRFDELLRDVLRTYEPVHSGVDVAVVLLVHLPPAEAVALLTERRRIIEERRARAGAELGAAVTSGPLATIAADHLLRLMEAELSWLDRSLAHLHALGWASGAGRDQPTELNHGS